MVNSVKAKHIPYENSGSRSGAWHQWQTENHHLFHRFIQLDLQNQISMLLEASLARNTQMSYIIGLNVIQKIRSGLGYLLLWPPQLNHGHTSQLYVFQCKMQNCDDVSK